MVLLATGAAAFAFAYVGLQVRKMLQAQDESLTASLSGPPRSAVVERGLCQFNEDFQEAKLLGRVQVTENSYLLRFALPDSSKPLNLSTCAYLLARKINPDDESSFITRAYTPISTNSQVGYFDLLVKKHRPGPMSSFLCEHLPVYDPEAEERFPGLVVEFAHRDSPNLDMIDDFPEFENNVSIQYHEFSQKKHIGMLAGGTGITPMLQVLHAILGDTRRDRDKIVNVRLLYGCRTSTDIIAKDLLDEWSNKYRAHFKVRYIVSDEPTESTWNGGDRGIISKNLINSFMSFPRNNNTMIFVCGPPLMYDLLCGPREEPFVLKGLLSQMGYKPKQVHKF